MGIMDEVRQQMGGGGAPPGVQGFLRSQEKHDLVSYGQPFRLVGLRRRTSQFTDDVIDPTTGEKTRVPRQEWLLDVLFLDKDTLQLMIMDDGEGGVESVGRTITMTATPYRNQEFGLLQEKLTQTPGGLGPLYLIRRAVQGAKNPAFMLGDAPEPQSNLANMLAGGQTPAPGSVPPANAELMRANAPVPPATQPFLSPDGKWMFDGQNWLPVPAPPTAASQLDVQAADVVPFLGAAGASAPAPVQPAGADEVRYPQPIPPTTIVQGGDGEGGVLVTGRVPGDQIRQATYLGQGVVEQPSGVRTQNVAPERPPEVAAQTTAAPTVERVTAPVQGPPGEAVGRPAGTPTVAPTVETEEEPKPRRGRSRSSVNFSAVCEKCGQTQKGPAFKNSEGKWIMTHMCAAKDGQGKEIGPRVLDVDKPVKQFLEADK